MLTETQVKQLTSEVLERLPRALERDPIFIQLIEELIAEKFPRRDEFARNLNELAALRQDQREEHIWTEGHFEQIDQRFNKVDEQLAAEQTNAQEHYDQIDQRFSQVNERFNQVNERFDAEHAWAQERFEQVDQRFEQVDQRLEQVDQRFDQVDRRLAGIDQRIDSLEARVDAGFQDLHRTLDRLGMRWGIRNESVFRQTVAALLEQSFGVKVETRHIAGEQFDCIIYDGQHILVEIAASAGKTIQKRLERKRDLYIQETGITPTRVVLVTSAIHSRRAQSLRDAGFEVIEPEEDVLDE